MEEVGVATADMADMVMEDGVAMVVGVVVTTIGDYKMKNKTNMTI